MADDEQKPGTAIMRTEEQAKAALARIAGKPKDEEVFWCMSCGFAEDANDPSKVRFPKGLTLKFEAGEIEALGGDIRSYSGPCPVCKFMTLVPMDEFTGESIREAERENRRADNRDMAKDFVDVVKQEVGGIFTGGMTPPDGPPGQHDDLPEEDAVADGDLTPRGQ